MLNHSCPNYLQKLNALELLEKEILKLGESACILLNSPYIGDIELLIRDCPIECIPIDTTPTSQTIEAYSKIICEYELEVLVAIGNEHALTSTRILATSLNLPFILVPTILDTEIYDANMVLVDESFMMNVPVQSFRYAITNTLATYIEGKAYPHSLSYTCIAKSCINTLIRDSEASYQALRNQTCTSSYSNMIEATLYMKHFISFHNETSLFNILVSSMKNFYSLSHLNSSDILSLALLITLKITNQDTLYHDCITLYQQLSIPQSLSPFSPDFDETQTKELTTYILQELKLYENHSYVNEFLLYQAILSIL